MNTEETKEYLTTAQVCERLGGMHRNSLTRFKDDLRPAKSMNGKDNLYDPDLVEAFIQKRMEQNPRIIRNPKVRTQP